MIEGGLWSAKLDRLHREMPLQEQVAQLTREVRELRETLSRIDNERAIDEASASPLMHPPTGALSAAVDRAQRAELIVKQLMSEHSELVMNAPFISGILENSSDCIKVLSLDGNLEFMSGGGHRVMEVDDPASILGCSWPSFWPGEGKAVAVFALSEARAGRIAHFEGEAPTAKGSLRWWDVTVSPISENGTVARVLSISRDISKRKAAEAHRDLLTRELQHRLKNTLAMVSAIVNQSTRGAATKEAARDTILSRIAALDNAQNILTRSSWTGAPLATVIREALTPHGFGDGAFEASGPDVMLTARQALSLVLALHELATNALKYGSLSTAEGRVLISWDLHGHVDVGRFDFEWCEVGGPPVSPPERQGFGSRLIERTLAADFKGEVRIEYPADGVRMMLKATLGDA